MNIYIYKNDQQLGPFDDAQISEALTSGQFAIDDLARTEEGTEWIHLGDLLKKTQTTSCSPEADEGFLAALFETSFNRFIALKVYGLVYKVAIMFVSVLSLIGFIFGMGLAYFGSNDYG
jgi:hypothetical protein